MALANHNVLVISSWNVQQQDVRSGWPADALVFETLLPEVAGWGEGGVLLAVACSRDNQGQVDYHCLSSVEYQI